MAVMKAIVLLFTAGTIVLSIKGTTALDSSLQSGGAVQSWNVASDGGLSRLSGTQSRSLHREEPNDDEIPKGPMEMQEADNEKEEERCEAPCEEQPEWWPKKCKDDYFVASDDGDTNIISEGGCKGCTPCRQNSREYFDSAREPFCLEDVNTLGDDYEAEVEKGNVPDVYLTFSVKLNHEGGVQTVRSDKNTAILFRNGHLELQILGGGQDQEQVQFLETQFRAKTRYDIRLMYSAHCHEVKLWIGDRSLPNEIAGLGGTTVPMKMTAGLIGCRAADQMKKEEGEEAGEQEKDRDEELLHDLEQVEDKHAKRADQLSGRISGFKTRTSDAGECGGKTHLDWLSEFAWVHAKIGQNCHEACEEIDKECTKWSVKVMKQALKGPFSLQDILERHAVAAKDEEPNDNEGAKENLWNKFCAGRPSEQPNKDFAAMDRKHQIEALEFSPYTYYRDGGETFEACVAGPAYKFERGEGEPHGPSCKPVGPRDFFGGAAVRRLCPCDKDAKPTPVPEAPEPAIDDLGDGANVAAAAFFEGYTRLTETLPQRGHGADSPAAAPSWLSSEGVTRHMSLWWQDIKPLLSSGNQQALISMSLVPALRFGCFTTVVALHASQVLGAGAKEIGYMYSVLALSQGLSTPIGSYSADMLSGARLALVLPAGLASCASFAALAYSTSLEHYLIAMALQGCCAGFTVPAQGAFRAEVTPQALRGQAASLERVAGSLVGLTAPVGLGFLADMTSCPTVMLLTAGLMTMCHALYLFRGVRGGGVIPKV